MRPSNEETRRCVQLSYAVCKLHGIIIEVFAAEVSRKSIATTQRLLRGLPHAPWDWVMIERACQLIGRKLQIPPSTIMIFIRGGPTDYDQQLRELAVARLVLPNPMLATTVSRKLRSYAEAQGSLCSHQFILPVSHVTDAAHDRFLINRTKGLGAAGQRFAGTMRTFARQRQLLTCSNIAFPNATEFLFIPRSALKDLQEGRGDYEGLADDDYFDYHRTMIQSSVIERGTRLGIYDERLLPSSLKTILGAYDGLMTIAGKFVMSVHRKRFTRGICERTIVPSPCNLHIDFVTEVLRSLKRYVPYDMDEKFDTLQYKIIEVFNAFAR